jgi:NhaP-type Na+/H+ or K+/H+ antiporter
LNLGVVIAVAAALVLWTMVAERFERWNISAPMLFVAAGLLLANWPLDLVDVHLGSSMGRELAELTLAVVLFGDAARVRLRELEADAVLPSRLLLIGLPLTIALGTLVAHLLLPGLSWWVCAVIGAAVAPTDAALGAPIIDDVRVPSRIRRVLNVESGLNDGIATPFVNIFLVAAVAGTALETESDVHAFIELGLGVVFGVLIGAGGGWLIGRARASGWGGQEYRHVGVAALALLSYAVAVHSSGNGFVAAFVAGLAYGAVTKKEDRAESLTFTHDSAELLSLVVWFLFGAVMVPLLTDIGWRELVFAGLALTVVRMAPVALALIGSRLDRSTVLVIGWFGPRGLASVVFALLAVDGLFPAEGERVLLVITTTVVASVVLHGLSAAPVAGRYGASHNE